MQPLWQREEEWALREVAPGEFRQLAAAAGLQVVQQQARWAAGWAAASNDNNGSSSSSSGDALCPDDAARIFVLRLAARPQH